jgi:CelD/BcsL family acetyltransferase involved in cellulose biosynthesis
MKIHHLSARRLTDELVAQWRAILERTPLLAGPYFRPEFTAAVAQVRDDVEVAVLEEASEILGFFPYQRTRWNVAQPVGGRLSDYQGVIADAEVYWLPGEILSACRLSAWEFDHQLAWQTPLAQCFARRATSPVIDLSPGYESWLESRKSACAELKETLRKMRKLHRESQSVEFTWHTTDAAIFAQLRAWKSAQYLSTGLDDIFRERWIVALLEMLRLADGPHLRGVLSTLQVDGRPIAIHFGMQANGTLHSWFPAYDPENSRCSPGQILLLKIAEHAAANGVQRIDLGRGEERYKLALASDAIEIAEGCFDRRPFAGAIRKGWSATRDWVRKSPLREPARKSLRWLREIGQHLGSSPSCERGPQ